MTDFLRYQRLIFIISVVLSALTCIILYAVLRENPAIARGVALGALAGLIKFRLDVIGILRMGQEMSTAGQATPVRTGFHTYILMAGALLLAVARPELFEPWAVFGGLLIPRAVLVLDGILRPGALQAEMAGQSTNRNGTEGEPQ